jgi:hypothetical protein
MKHNIFILLALVAVFMFSSCQNDPVSAPQSGTQYVLEIKPDSLVGEVYVNYQFKARLNGMSTSDVDFVWTSSDSDNFNLHYDGYKMYRFPGNYTITARAYDRFADTLIATKTVPVHINQPHLTVDILPNSIDTVLPMNEDGSLQSMLFTVKSSIPVTESQVHWHFDDGPADTMTWRSTIVDHAFKYLGPHSVKAEVYDTKGNFIGADSSIITIHFPFFDLSTLQNFKRVSVYLKIDSTSSVYGTKGLTNPFAMGLLQQNDANNSFSWSGKTFIGGYHEETGLGTSNYHLIDYRMNGELGSDLMSVKSLGVQTLDTAYQAGSYTGIVQYSFNLHDLVLLSVTPTKIIYAAKNNPLSNFASDIQFISRYLSLSQCGNPISIGLILLYGVPSNAPYALVIFSN